MKLIKYNFFIFAIFIAPLNELRAQSTEHNTGDKVFEGIRLFNNIAEILSRKKQEHYLQNSRECEEIKTANICFKNSSLGNIEVNLRTKTSPMDSLQNSDSLVIPPNERGCKIQIRAGIYHLKIRDLLNDNIKFKSDIKVVKCDDLEFEIK